MGRRSKRERYARGKNSKEGNHPSLQLFFPERPARNDSPGNKIGLCNDCAGADKFHQMDGGTSVGTGYLAWWTQTVIRFGCIELQNRG